MPTTSTYPSITAALKDLLTTELGSEVSVIRGGGPRLMQKDNVLIGGVEKGSHTWPVMRAGRKPRDEQYLLIVNINCVRLGVTEPTTAEERAFELLSALENLLAEYPGLDLGIPTLRINMEEFEADSFMEDQGGWRCVIVAKLLVQCRLT